MVMLSYKFRLYPSQRIQDTLNDHIELCHWMYNRLLSAVNTTKQQGRKVGKKSTQALIVKLKHAEKPELTKVYSKVLQMVNYQLWSNLKALSALKNQGKTVGKLRYKGTGRFKTLTYNQSGFELNLEANKPRLSKIDDIPINVHRAINGMIKGVIIKRSPSGNWFALVQVDASSRLEVASPPGKAVGMNVGLTHFLTDIEGRQMENPKFYERTLAKLRLLQRGVSRKKR